MLHLPRGAYVQHHFRVRYGREFVRTSDGKRTNQLVRCAILFGWAGPDGDGWGTGPYFGPGLPYVATIHNAVFRCECQVVCCHDRISVCGDHEDLVDVTGEYRPPAYSDQVDGALLCSEPVLDVCGACA